MRAATSLCFGVFAAALLAKSALPQDSAEKALSLYAVGIGGGHGIYLGKGLIITAAHVVGLLPRVKIAGNEVAAKIVKRGDLDDVDLTLLSIDEEIPARLGLGSISLCRNPAGTGEPVFVVLPEKVTQTYVLSQSLLPPNIPAKFQTVIRDVGSANSGTGVFDAKEKCLLGIVSRKISAVQMKQVNGETVREPIDIAKYFVPAAEIANFMPPDVRF